ncbi:MAG: polysaccharide deacetylase family protein [Phycisphaerales bacterium]
MFLCVLRQDHAAPLPAPVVPVLMYHHIREPLPSDGPAARFIVSPTAFGAQLDYLRANGYTAIDTTRLADAILRGARLPEKPVLITFDDGWQEHATIVLPMLRERGMVGVFFIHTGAPGEEPGSYVSWTQVCELEESGMDVESHTIGHPSLPAVDSAVCEHELRESRRVLELKLQRPVLAVAYPFGDFTEREIEAARRAGYQVAFSTEVGLRQDAPMELHRTIVTSTDTIDDFAIKLTEVSGDRALLDYRQSITPLR